MNPFVEQHEWLQRRYRECIADLNEIESAIGTMLARQPWEFVADYDVAVLATLTEHGVSPQMPQFASLFKQASGVFRQMAHIVELIGWTKPTTAFVCDERHDYRSWRWHQLDRIASGDIRKLLEVSRVA
jgi:hypothetical protein